MSAFIDWEETPVLITKMSLHQEAKNRIKIMKFIVQMMIEKKKVSNCVAV
jgi:hypothetical protein